MTALDPPLSQFFYHDRISFSLSASGQLSLSLGSIKLTISRKHTLESPSSSTVILHHSTTLELAEKRAWPSSLEMSISACYDHKAS